MKVKGLLVEEKEAPMSKDYRPEEARRRSGWRPRGDLGLDVSSGREWRQEAGQGDTEQKWDHGIAV